MGVKSIKITTMKNFKAIKAMASWMKALVFVLSTISGSLLFTACSKDEVIETIDTVEEAIVTEENLDDLMGEWVRIASNNPGADGMIIDISGTTGKLTDKAKSNFVVGDIKWKNIKPVDAENYSYEELGSDYNYYPATMELKADDTLRISVGSSGAGNLQKWVREGEYIPTDGQEDSVTETLPCNISSARTLKNGSAAVDYIVDCVLDITAPLTIEPGVVIQFGENAGLGIYDGGTLNAIGTETEPIVFSGESDIRGWWRGIHLETRSVNNRLEHVRIEDAGSNYVYCCNEKASLFLKGAKIALKDVYMNNGGGFGLLANGDTAFDMYSNIRIETHQDYPVRMSPDLLSALDGTASDYSGNDKDFVFVTGEDISTSTSWLQLNVPYLLEGRVIDITQAFILEAGVEMVFQEGGGLGVYDEGSLTVNGLETNPVTMRGAEAVKGFWRGIHIETTDLANSLNYLQVSDAGSNYVYCCNDAGSLFLKDGTASVTNSTFSNGKSYGIVVRPTFEFNTFEGNTITSHEQAPMYIPAKTMGELDGMESSYQGNDKEYLLVYNSDIKEDMTVRPTNVPFQIEIGVVIDITARLNLQAGVEMVFEENSGLGVYDSGIFNLMGSLSEKIVLRGSENTVGYWRGIHTETNSVNNIIQHTEIRNAGSNYVYCCNSASALYIKSGQMTLENSSISDSGGCAVTVRSGVNFTENGNSYSNNALGDLCN